MMTAAKLAELARLAKAEPTMTRVALDDLADPATIRKQLQTEYDKHVRSHEGISGLVDRIMRVTGMRQGRAQRIARTEKTKASNGGRFAALADSYLRDYYKARKNHKKRPERPLIMWIDPETARHPRDGHVAITGFVVAIGERFPNGLRFPGDPDAPIEEVANCHCYIRKARKKVSRPDEPVEHFHVGTYKIEIDAASVFGVTPPRIPRVIPIPVHNAARADEPVEPVETVPSAQPAETGQTTVRVAYEFPLFISRRTDRRARLEGHVLAVTVQGTQATIGVLLDGGAVAYVQVSAGMVRRAGINVGDAVTVRGKYTRRGELRVDSIMVRR